MSEQNTHADGPVPDVVTTYLDARDAGDHAGAVATFSPEARVDDDGGTYVGIDAIAAWIQHSSSQFTYTSTRLDHRVAEDGRVMVRVRLDGNFPGGTVTLNQRFDLDDGLIRHLEIAP